MRGPFQRDRDRIIHATAFRRLTHKTQVFVYHEGDHYRTRLTHSLEVAQIARALARQLALDEDLAEALALAHDLGHPPFGHAGERALDRTMADFGGFDHNAQSFKIVTRLERKYPAFDGLNLTYETLEGLVKHNGPLTGPATHVGVDLLAEAIAEEGLTDALQLASFAPAEAQVAAIADDIAYNNHDIDDGLRAKLITLAELPSVPLAGHFVPKNPPADPARIIYEVNRRLITAMIEDVIAESRRRLAALGANSVEDIRHAGRAVVAFSDAFDEDVRALKGFLMQRVYRHPVIMKTMTAAEGIVTDIFAAYLSRPEAMPATWRETLADLDEVERGRRIGDFVAGMTDRYAIQEHRRLFDATPELG